MTVLLKELIERGKPDWIHASDITEIVAEYGGASSFSEIRAVAVDVIREGLEEGLFRIGDVTEAGFQEWSLPISDAVDRVSAEWPLDRYPTPGDVCWLDITPKALAI